MENVYVAYPEDWSQDWILNDSVVGWYCKCCGAKVSCKITEDGSYFVACECGRKEAAGKYLN